MASSWLRHRKARRRQQLPVGKGCVEETWPKVVGSTSLCFAPQSLEQGSISLEESPGKSPFRRRSMLTVLDEDEDLDSNSEDSFAAEEEWPLPRKMSQLSDTCSYMQKAETLKMRNRRRSSGFSGIIGNIGETVQAAAALMRLQRRTSAYDALGDVPSSLGDSGSPSKEPVQPAVLRTISAGAHRRNSRAVARRQSFWVSQGSVEEAIMNPVSAGGPLMDFVLRSQHRPLFDYDTLAQQLNDLCKKDLFLEYDEAHKHSEAVAILLKEALYNEIMRFLLTEMKLRGRGVNSLEQTRPGRLRELVGLIVKSRREFKCLAAEVEAFGRTGAELNAHVCKQEDPRSKFQKLEKVVGFWLDHHARAWESRHLQGERPRSRQSMKGERPLSKQGSKSRLSLATLGNSASAPELHSSEHLSPAGLTQTRLPPLGAISKPGEMKSPQLRPATLQPLAGSRLPPVVSRVQYLGACEGSQLTPKTLTFTTGFSSVLHAAGRNLLDHDLLAIADALPSTQLEEVDLRDCKSLSDRSLVPFLGGLVGSHARKTLRRLVLGQCVRASLGMQQTVVEVLHVVEGLRHLDISSVPIARKFQWPLCEAIKDHAYLEYVNLSDIGLGLSPQSKDCIGALGSSKLKRMDIGWNCFSSEEFLCFGESLRDNDFIECLNVPKATGKLEGVDSPISFLLECLGYVKNLQKLDISMNGIDYQLALILEDALERHANLTHINLSGNSLGVLGLRSIFRLMAQRHSGLVHLNLSEAFLGTSPTGGHVQIFRATNPGSRYEFDLARPYHRSFLRMLYKWCDRFKLTPDQAFQSVVNANGNSYKHPAKDANGVRLVPTQGAVSLIFSIERGIETTAQGVKDEDFHGFLYKHYATTRFSPPFKKMIPIISCWKGLTGMEYIQNIFLRALSVDFTFSLAQLQALCDSCRARADEVICSLLPTLPGDTARKYLAGLSCPDCGQYLTAKRRSRQFVGMNIENPTGRYSLELGNSCDFAVAQNLLLLDRWEVLVDLRCRRFDISSRGTRSHLRNEHYRSLPLLLVCESISDWALPEVGLLEFDYASSVRPPQGVEVIGEKSFNYILTELSDCTAPPHCQIGVLRWLSSWFYVTAMQLRLMLGMFRTKEERAEAFVAFYLRCVDMWNSKVFLVRFGDSEEKLKLQKRLGYATFFPFIQPENERFELDLSFHDQRLCCTFLVTLSLHEKASNIRDPRFILPDGTRNPLPQGVPRSWESLDRVPTGGVFSGTYVCAPDDRQFDLRKKLAQTYGYFKTTVCESQVLWWAGLYEPPHEVLLFLEFLFDKVSNSDKAFDILDRENTGVITLRSLEEAVASLGCHKFDGEAKYDKIEVVFRYLDPGMEGAVTKDEWETVKQLWNEYEHSACEFAQFLVRTFGEDFSEAWECLLDAAGVEQQMNEDQFVHVMEELGYFGPTDIVFHILDADDNMHVSGTEFAKLARYKRLPNLTRKSTIKRGMSHLSADE